MGGAREAGLMRGMALASALSSFSRFRALPAGSRPEAAGVAQASDE